MAVNREMPRLKELRQSLPSVRFIVFTVIVCLVLGVVITGGIQPRALFGLAIAAIFIAMVTLRNSDPMTWEAIHEPRAHSLRLQRDTLAKQLWAVVNAYESGDGNSIAITSEIDRARELLANLHRRSKA